MVMHSQEIEERKKTEHENLIWWELDKIAIVCSNQAPESTREERMLKAKAATNMMSFLRKPTAEWAREKYRQEVRGY